MTRSNSREHVFPCVVVSAVALGLQLTVPASLALDTGATLVPPNIVIFYADDMGLGDCGAYQDLTGNADAHQIRTPNMVRLAAMGARFTDAHSASAVCTPSRVALLSGVYPFRSPLKQLVGYVGQDIRGTYFPGDRRTVPWMLRRYGYGTFGYGKWHLGLQGDTLGTGVVDEGPLQLGFDTFMGSPANFGDGASFNTGGMIRDNQILGFDASWDLVPINDPTAQTWSPPSDPEFIKRIQQINLDTMQADLAAHLQNDGEKPFFVYYASHGNHTPFIMDDQIEGVPLTTDVTVAGGIIPIALVPDDDGDGIPEPNDPLYDPQEDTHWDPYYEPATRTSEGTNGPTERARMVVENDIILGVLLDFLEATDDPRLPGGKLIDNTLVIFTSDNGADLRGIPPVGGLPQESDGVTMALKGRKATPWEGGTRIPLIAAWPERIPAGGTSDALFGQVDFYATLAAIVGHDMESSEAVDSSDVLAALTAGASGVVRDIDLAYKQKHNLMIRRGSFKLRAQESDYVDTGNRFGDGLDFLDLSASNFYDLFNDLDESQNRINDGSVSALVGDMLATLQQFVSQGFSRTGAAAIPDSVNFHGGDFHSGTNWRSYTVTIDQQIPGEQVPATGFVAVDGFANRKVSGTRIVQRAGTFDFVSASPVDSAIADGSAWYVEGGILTDANSALRVDGGGHLVVDGGDVDLLAPGQFLGMTTGAASIELRRGTIGASVLAFGLLANSSPGQKIFRCGPGDGLMMLADDDPIRFGDDGDTVNDWIDFVTGSRCRFVTSLAVTDYQALWQSGRLRIDSQTGADLGATLLQKFRIVDNGDGTTTLSLLGPECDADLNSDGSADMFDLLLLLARVDALDDTGDVDGSGVVDQHDVLVFLSLLERGCSG